jgi:hypothetical protein
VDRPCASYYRRIGNITERAQVVDRPGPRTCNQTPGLGFHNAAQLAMQATGYLRPSFSISFFISVIYRFLCKILFSISHFSPTTFSKSRSLYIKPYIRNIFCSKFFVRTYLLYLKCYGYILFLFNPVFKT